MHEKMENKFEQVLRAENPVNYTDIKADIIVRSVALKNNPKGKKEREMEKI